MTDSSAKETYQYSLPVRLVLIAGTLFFLHWPYLIAFVMLGQGVGEVVLDGDEPGAAWAMITVGSIVLVGWFLFSRRAKEDLKGTYWDPQ